MQLASVMAGFSLGEADLLRRAMSKKKRATMEGMRTKFMKGAQAVSYTHLDVYKRQHRFFETVRSGNREN